MAISGISGSDSYYYYLQQLQKSGSQTSSVEQIFSKIDSNGDGSVSKDELAAFESSMTGASADSVLTSQMDSMSLFGLMKDAEQLDAATGTTTSTDELFSTINTSGSGAISKSELETFASGLSAQSGSSTAGSDTSAIDQLFSKIDTNGDGAISKSEFETFAPNMKTGAQDSALPPPPVDMQSFLNDLLQNLDGSSSSTAGTTTSSTTTGAGASTGSTSDSQNTANALSLMLEAIGKYMQLAQAGQSGSAGLYAAV